MMNEAQHDYLIQTRKIEKHFQNIYNDSFVKFCLKTVERLAQFFK